MSGKWFKVVSYGVRKEDHLLDMDAIEKTAHETKPKLILAGGTAYSRILGLEALSRDRRRGRRLSDGRHGPYRGPRRRRRASLATAACPCRHDHDHKSLRGPRGGMILCNDEDIAKKMNSAVFPGLQGGPLMHVIAAKAVAFGEALKPSFKDSMPRASPPTPRRSRRASRKPASISSPAAPTTI
jgi:glycine hydroxymethyltransferase